MSEVTRYDVLTNHRGEIVQMVRDNDGVYMSHADHARIVAEMRAEIEALKAERIPLLSAAVENELVFYDEENNEWLWDSNGEPIAQDSEPWGRAKEMLEKEARHDDE